MRRTTLLLAAGAALLLSACAPGAREDGAARGDSALPADSGAAAPRQPDAPAPEGASDAVPADTADTSLPPPPRLADTAGGGAEQGRAAIARLEREVKALARAAGCDAASQCRSVAVGAKGCGGPRYYLPYCPRSTDEKALLAKADELRRAEEAYNRANQIASTCEMILEPRLELSGGSCRAASGAPESTPQG